jgi:hypothetical protein
LFVFLIFAGKPVLSDDTCMFAVSADDVPPNIVLLLDNGAEMENIIWHAGYNNSFDYTPAAGSATITWGDGSMTNGFTNEQGYTVHNPSTGTYYIRPILSDLTPDADNGHSFLSDSNSNTFTINGRSITLPFEPSEYDGIIDNAAIFRYSKNYLNWLFYGSYLDVSSVDDGTDLSDKSRFYYAKQAIFTVAELIQRQAYFGIYAFTANAKGASNVQPLKFACEDDGTFTSAFDNAVNTLGTVNYSPLAEGLASIGVVYASPKSATVTVVAVEEYCQKSFVIVITSGVSSEDQGITSDYDGDGLDVTQTITIDGVEMAIPVNQNGGTYLDDVAYDLYSRDVIGYQPGFQNVTTYTIGFMGNDESNAYLKNASNNGNGNLNLYDTSDKEYGKYHFEAENPDALSGVLINAINAILSKTSSFTAPVVPVTRTTSGNQIYLAFFKPGESNFWEGNVTKFGLSSDGEILDANGIVATWANGAMKEDADPYWGTIDWADTSKTNGIDNSARNIYTYLGVSNDLTGHFNWFSTDNDNLTSAELTTYDDSIGPLELDNITGIFDDGEPLTGTDSGATATSGTITSADFIPYTGRTGSFRKGETVTGSTSGAVGTIASAGTTELINYIRGADVHDEDEDNNTSENRAIICGDPLHSEPVVVNYGDLDSDGDDEIMVFFGANDGMLHAVNDDYGSEAWLSVESEKAAPAILHWMLRFLQSLNFCGELPRLTEILLQLLLFLNSEKHGLSLNSELLKHQRYLLE